MSGKPVIGFTLIPAAIIKQWSSRTMVSTALNAAVFKLGAAVTWPTVHRQIHWMRLGTSTKERPREMEREAELEEMAHRAKWIDENLTPYDSTEALAIMALGWEQETKPNE